MFNRLNRYLYKTAPHWFIGLGIILMLTSQLHRYLYNRSLTLSDELVRQHLAAEAKYEGATTSTDRQARPSKPTHIYTQWRLDVPVDEEVFVDGVWTIADSHASWLSTSARPGENGNIIIYGHNKREILGNIRVFDGEEIVKLTMGDGTTKEYKVKEVFEVSPKQTKFLEPTNNEVLTIYTCSGLMDSKRFIARAYPLGLSQ